MRWNVISGLMLKYWYISINRLDRIFDIVYWPVVSLLIWGFTSYYLKGFTGESIIKLFVGGIVLWVFFQRAQQDISVFILEEFWSRNLYNLFASPLTENELITAVSLFGTLRSFLSFIVLGLLSYFLYHFNIFESGILVAMMFFSVLTLFGWVVGIFVSALIFRYGMRIQVFAWSFAFLIQPFSAVFYPLDSMPLVVRKISYYLPTTHVFEGMRYAFNYNKIPWFDFWYALIVTLVLLFLSILFFKESIRYARKKGLLSREE